MNGFILKKKKKTSLFKYNDKIEKYENYHPLVGSLVTDGGYDLPICEMHRAISIRAYEKKIIL